MTRLSPGRAAVVVSVAALCVAVVAGCSNKKDGGADPASTGSSTTARSGANGSAAPSKAASIDPSKVIARQTFKLRETPEDTVEVGVVSLVVSGKVATLRLVFTPHLQSKPAADAISIYDTLDKTPFSPYLMDLEHLKRYDVVRGTGISELKSDEVETKTVNGTSMAGFAVFAAPEDGARTIDVHISEWWPEFQAVPVQR